jgi:hypothetical protein
MLNFSQIDFDYTLFKRDGTKEKGESFKWDIAAGKAL